MAMFSPPRPCELLEEDVDRAVILAGGSKFLTNASPNAPTNADYIYENSVIELKLITEEALIGRDKSDRQKRVAKIFDFDPKPVVVIDPARLSEDRKREFENELSGPIHSAVVKASKQLKTSRTGDQVTVLLAVNIGFMSIDMDTFADLVVRRVRRNTKSIDVVITAGIYMHGDGLDNQILTHFDEHIITNGSRIRNASKLSNAWQRLCGDIATKTLLPDPSRRYFESPTTDVSFKVGPKTYIKPAPSLGPSTWLPPRARPRLFSGSFPDGIATTFPLISESDWTDLKRLYPESDLFLENFLEWNARIKEFRKAAPYDTPFVCIDVTIQEVNDWVELHNLHPSDNLVFRFAAAKFNRMVSLVRETSKDLNPDNTPFHFMLVEIWEIGQSQDNDVCRISACYRNPFGFESELVIDYVQLPLERACALAASYCVEMGVYSLRVTRDKTYCWV